MFYVHMLLLLAVIFVGIRYGGIASVYWAVSAFLFLVSSLVLLPGRHLLALCSLFLRLLQLPQRLKQQAV